LLWFRYKTYGEIRAVNEGIRTWCKRTFHVSL